VGWLNHDTPVIEWTQPDAKLAAENLIQLGAKAIVFMPIGFVTENHETLLDVEHIIEALQRQYSDINYIQMECANDHPEFLHMAAHWADPHIEDLLSEEALAVNTQLGVEHHHHHHHDHDPDHSHHHHHHH
jgi:ferrochelatase